MTTGGLLGLVATVALGVLAVMTLGRSWRRAFRDARPDETPRS